MGLPEASTGARPAPQWNSDSVIDPDGEAMWLAVDTHPTEESARAAATELYEFVEVSGTVKFRLRWLDLDDEGDRYIHEEWGAETTVEADDEHGREFWLVITHPMSPYREAEQEAS